MSAAKKFEQGEESAELMELRNALELQTKRAVTSDLQRDEWVAKCSEAEERLEVMAELANEACARIDERQAWIDGQEAKNIILSACLRKSEGQVDALVAAAEKCLAVLPGLEVRSWPGGDRLKAEAIAAARAAIAKVRGEN